MEGYVWYSYGSDQTGPKLADQLGFKCGKKLSSINNLDILIGWGCKPNMKYNVDLLSERVARRQLRVLNYPNKIADNRDKLASLIKLKGANISIPGFIAGNNYTLLKNTLEALEAGEIDFPIIGLNRFHKGYPTFCYTIDDLVQTCKTKQKEQESLDYFRSFCPGTEFRINVFRDTVLAASKKVLSENPLQKFGQHLLNKVKKRAKKAEVKLCATEQEIGWIANELAYDIFNSPTQMQRSITHGWSLQDCPLIDVPNQVLSEAIGAIDASELDMGAVSLIWDNKIVRVTSIISAPNLNDEQMGLYVSEIKEFINVEKPKKNRVQVKTEESTAPVELIARVKRKIPGLSLKTIREILKTLEE